MTLSAGNSLCSIKKIAVGQGHAQVFMEPDGKFLFVADQGTEAKPSNTISKTERFHLNKGNFDCLTSQNLGE